MALIIKEYLESDFTVVERNLKDSTLSLTESYSTYDSISKESIMVDIEGIHVGPTRNFTWYTKEALRGSRDSWTKPYQKPLILHHNEKNGKTIGRVIDVDYTEKNTRSNTGALVFTCNVADEDGKAGIKDGRLKTTSIGVIATLVTCSICGHDITENGECEHDRGSMYGKERCYWMIHEMEAKELSYVIVPSDIFAHNIKVYSPLNNNNLIEGRELKMEKDLETNQEENLEQKPVEKLDIKESVDLANAENLKLKAKITELEESLKLEEAKSKLAEELKENAETELIEVTAQLKESSIENMMMIREKLNKPVLAKETFINRSSNSIADSILDLKEELIEFTKKPDVEEIKIAENKVEEVVIEKVLSESLVDENKDSSIKSENKSELEVKESVIPSNTNNEDNLKNIMSFYKL